MTALICGATFSASAHADEFEVRYQGIAASKVTNTDLVRHQELFQLDWAYTMAVCPEFATYSGYPGGDTQWTDLTPAAIVQRKQLAGRALSVLATSGLAQPVERISNEIFEWRGEEKVRHRGAVPLSVLEV